MSDLEANSNPATVEAILEALTERIETIAKVAETALRKAQETPQQKEEEGVIRARLNPLFEEGESSLKPKVAPEPTRPDVGLPKPSDLEKGSRPESPVCLSGEPILLSSKVEALERALRGIRKADDLIDMGSLSLFPNARMPTNFRMPELERFDGMGCPKTHLKMYVRAMHPRGANDDLLAQLFHESLTGSALKWFLSLDDSKMKTWEDVCTEFTNHYRYNTEVDVTRRDLETTKQEPRETFSAFITRWRAKASKMTNRPEDMEQIQMVIKNLLPVYHKHLCFQYLPDFRALIDTGTKVEDALVSGTLRTDEPYKNRRPVINGKATEVNTISQTIPPTQPFTLNNKPFRKFTELHMSLEKVFEKLKTRGLLRPLEPRPTPNPLPKNYNENEYCHFHQSKGHTTNRCIRLRHEIEDLIDNKTISPPSQPNVTQNPLPTHAVPPPANINVIHLDNHRNRQPIRPYTTLPTTLTEMFHYCQAQGLITAFKPRSKNPYCLYHAMFGHDTENCDMLRKIVQDLIDQDIIKIPQPYSNPRGTYRSWRRFERDTDCGWKKAQSSQSSSEDSSVEPKAMARSFGNGTSQRQLKARFEARDPSVDLLTVSRGKFGFYVLCPEDPMSCNDDLKALQVAPSSAKSKTKPTRTPSKTGTSQWELKKRYEAGDPEVGLLGEPSGKFDFYVIYPKNLIFPTSSRDPLAPSGWDDIPPMPMEDRLQKKWDDLPNLLESHVPMDRGDVSPEPKESSIHLFGEESQAVLKEHFEKRTFTTTKVTDVHGKVSYLATYPRQPWVTKCFRSESSSTGTEGIGSDDEVDMLQWEDLMNTPEDISDIWANDDEEVNHVTRGGRHFKPTYLESENPLGELERPQRTEVQEEEEEILKQLKRTQANITIWGLLMASQKHRQTVLRLLNQVQIPIDTSPEGLVSLVSPMHHGPSLSFTESDLPKNGSNHLRALYVTVDAMGKRIPTVLIDNGSALNVCPLSTATSLGIEPSEFKPSGQTVRAYDNTRREVIGMVTLPLIIGPVEFKVDFQVLDVPACFNLLLGRPWLHPTGAVPSSLHQKVKFPHQGSVVTLRGDSEISSNARIPICEIKHETEEIPLSGFEYVTCVEAEPHVKELMTLDYNPYGNLQVGQIMKIMGFFPGMGLGRRHQGIPNPIKYPSAIYPFGLGFQSTKADRATMEKEKRERQRAKEEGRVPNLALKPYKPTLNGAFVKEGEDFPYCGFPEPIYLKDRKIQVPGFEIFFDTQLLPIPAAVEEEHGDPDWANHLDLTAMEAMFKEVVCIEEHVHEPEPISSIEPTTVPLSNWSLEDKSQGEDSEADKSLPSDASL